MRTFDPYNAKEVQQELTENVLSLSDLFDLSRQKYPDNIALIDPAGVTLTYEELGEKVDRLASELSSRGVKKGDRVVLILEKSQFMLEAILANLKLGAIYVPIDSNSPNITVDQIIEETQPTLVMLDIEALPKVGNNFVDLLFSDINLDQHAPFEDYPQIDPDDNAYIIYTSGTTGRKKGVLIQHKAIINTLKWRIAYYAFTPQDAVLQIPSYAFDSSVIDIFSCIGAGARLVLVDDRRKTDMDYFLSKIEEYNITHFVITPSFYTYVLSGLKREHTLRIVTLAGEATSLSLKNTHYEKLPDVQLINEYGPTENAVCSTYKAMMKEDSEITIGIALPNVDVMILNEELQPVEQEEKGEIYLGGIGLARCYYQQEKLTSERFVLMDEKRWYKTGDVATFNAANEIRYYGRADRQIQLNGYRVELSEIELQVNQLNLVDQFKLVAKKKEGDPWRIVGFYLGEQKITSGDFREKLQAVLPSYMLPNDFFKVEYFPLTQNGKLDDNKLWDWYTSQEKNAEDDLAETTYASEMEKKIAKLIGAITKTDNVPVDKDFFTLGIDSLNSIKLIEEIFRETGTKILLPELYKHPSIMKLAQELLKRQH